MVSVGRECRQEIVGNPCAPCMVFEALAERFKGEELEDPLFKWLGHLANTLVLTIWFLSMYPTVLRECPHGIATVGDEII